MMLRKIQGFFKRKKYKILESYFEAGHDIKIKEDEDGKQLISLRKSSENQLIEITIDKFSVKHVIYDGLKGVTQEIKVPINIYEKVIDLNTPRSETK